MERSDEASKAKVIEMVKGLNIAMLSTRGLDGKFHSRPMAASDVTFDGTLYFLTDVTSGKVHDLETDSETIVTFSDHHTQKYVCHAGATAPSRPTRRPSRNTGHPLLGPGFPKVRMTLRSH